MVAPRLGTSAGSPCLSLGVWDTACHVLDQWQKWFKKEKWVKLLGIRIHFYRFRSCRVYKTIKPDRTPIIIAQNAALPPLLTPAFGLAFCKYAVVVAPGDEQLAVPQSHPLGQQSPPRVASQVVQPVAQFPVGLFAVAAGPTGTTIVTPLLMIVVELVTGQDVVSQFLPVRQHPPA